MTNILITGANSGLGRAIAIDYADKGVNLYLIARDMQRLEKVAKICREKGANVEVKQLNVIDRERTREYFYSLKDITFDIVFANAGVSGGTAGGFFESFENVYKIFDTNIFGVVNTIIPLLPNMVKNKHGRIVLISSMASFRGMPTAPAYSASKACIRYYGEALNNYLKEFNINVNVVCPGFIKTNMTAVNEFPMPFMMTPEYAVKKIKQGIAKNKKFIIFPKILYFGIKLLNIVTFGHNDWFYCRLPKKK